MMSHKLKNQKFVGLDFTFYHLKNCCCFLDE